MTTMRRAMRVLAATVVTGAAVLVPLAAPATAGGGGGCHATLGGEPPTQATGATLELKSSCLSPTVLRVEPGTEVTFVNRDSMLHNLYGPGLAIEQLGIGESESLRFTDAGTYPYACTFHIGMVGAVVVGDGRFPADVAAPQAVAVTSTTTTAAPVPLAATRPVDDDSGSTSLVILLSVGLTMVVAASAYAFGRRSAVLGAHDRADG